MGLNASLSEPKTEEATMYLLRFALRLARYELEEASLEI
jgi:hypothetical protein